MNSSVRLVRLGSMEVGIHYAWLVIVALVIWSLSACLLPQQYPDWPIWLHWLTAVTASLLLTWSVLLHEVAHASVALWRGVHTTGPVLFTPGGASSGWMRPARPGDELLIALAGPATNLALAAGLGGLYWLALPVGDPVSAPLAYGASINLMLALFNLLPCYPLDGAYAVRGALWKAVGDPTTAALVASSVGRIMGLLFVLVGILFFVNGAFMSGTWVAFVGALFVTAAGNVRQVALETNGSKEKALPIRLSKRMRVEIPLYYRGAVVGVVRRRVTGR